METDFSNPSSLSQEQAALLPRRFRLANGLRVWAQPRPGTGTVALGMQIMVGARYETAANNGISHFLEHMLFTGTERWSESELGDVISRLGGTTNAQTGTDDTMVYLHLGAEHLPLAVEWLRQVVFRPTLQPDKVDKERNVILNEMGGEAARLRRVYEWLEDRHLGWNVARAVRRQLYPDSALLLPVIGTETTLRAIHRDALLAHYQRYYTPSNMVLIVVGDFEPEGLRALLDEALQDVPGDGSAPIAESIVFDRSPFVLRLRGPAPNDQGKFLLGAPLGTARDPDRYAWWVLADILERALTQEIRYRQGLTYDVSVYTRLRAEGGYLAVYTQTEVESFPQVRAVVEHELDRLLAGDFAPGEIEDTQAMIRGRSLLSLQSNLDYMWWHAVDTLLVQGENEPIPDYLGGIAAVDAAAIVRAANEYLRPEQRFHVIHHPAITPRTARPWVAAGTAALSAALVAWRWRRAIPRRRPPQA